MTCGANSLTIWGFDLGFLAIICGSEGSHFLTGGGGGGGGVMLCMCPRVVDYHNCVRA